MRRAFVMGSNGPENLSPLRYARKDAENIIAALSEPSCGFTVETPRQEAGPWELRQQIAVLAEACTSEDTFVCYFSGHGILEKGALFLLWDKTERERLLNTAIPVTEIMQALKYCRAHSKLLILDCCHAGAVVNMTGLKDAAGTSVNELEISPDNHLVLMASDRLEKARELEALQGSFLTANICAALTEKFSEADQDGDNRISIYELKQWLEKRAKAHNRQFPDRTVPYPYLFGQQKGEFFLTIGAADWVPYELPWPDGSTMVVLPFYPKDEHALLISKHPITNAQYRQCVENDYVSEPVGKHLIDHQWRGPFYPWRESQFSDPDKPVVCVSLPDAHKYCEYISYLYADFPISNTKPPTPQEWDLAAFGTIYPSREPRTWLMSSSEFHHEASSPARIDNTGVRTNARGISDMIGNVWEWCTESDSAIAHAALGEESANDPELRGGGFLDNLLKVAPFLSFDELKGRRDIRHSDLGFRISARLDLMYLPEEVQRWLSLCPLLPAFITMTRPATR